MGCRKQDGPDEMIRLVLGENGELLVDLAGRAFGRGGWVHARLECLSQTARGGGARSFHATVTSSLPELLAQLRGACDQRVGALLSGARGAARLAIGTDGVEAAFASGQAALILLASDARAAAEAGFLARAGAKGKVVLWGTKAGIGRALGRTDTALVAVTDTGFANAIARTIAIHSLSEPDAPRPDIEHAAVEVR